MSELTALLDGREVGIVRQSKGRLNFTYADAWRGALGAYPLSLSMPIAAAEHPHSAIDPFLWGLLPDNEFVLSRWAQKFQVSARNPFALLAHVGEDCAGAVQFVRPAGLATLNTIQDVQWLSDVEIADRLRDLRVDASNTRTPRDNGQFSLAGAHPKTALLFDGKRWGVPSGRMPTTHILKPTTPQWDGHAENEHLCLSLARALGLPTAQSEVRHFEDVTAIVLTRYDRIKTSEAAAGFAAKTAALAAQAAMPPNENPSAMIEVIEAATDARNLSEFAKTAPIYRVHQEDLCQSLAVHPSRKYQHEGGPSPNAIAKLLEKHSFNSAGYNRSKTQVNNDEKHVAANSDISTFLHALIFHWLIGGTDAHAKNYSVLIGGNGLVRLAPLYDIASILAYPHEDPMRVNMAMKIGGTYRMGDIGLAEWRKLARELRVDEGAVLDRIVRMADELPDRLADEIKTMKASKIEHSVLQTLGKVLVERAANAGRKA